MKETKPKEAKSKETKPKEAKSKEAKTISVHPEHRCDPHYRYRMPVMQIHYQGKNQNTKTFIDNLEAISEKLGRAVESILQFFKTCLKVRLDKNSLRGQHDNDKLQHILDKFITLYVLCKCGSPETNIISEHSKPEFDCRACGLRRFLPDDNMRSTLVKEAKTITSSLEAFEIKGKEEDIVWSVSTSPTSVRRRKAEHMARTPETMVCELVKNDKFDHIKELATEQGWDDKKLAYAIVNNTFNSLLVKQLGEHASVLTKFDDKFKIVFMVELARWCSYHYPELWLHYPRIYQQLYNYNIVTEVLFLSWIKDGIVLIPKFYNWLNRV